jgi:hypothetical protein
MRVQIDWKHSNLKSDAVGVELAGGPSARQLDKIALWCPTVTVTKGP